MKTTALFAAISLSLPLMVNAAQTFNSTADGKTIDIPANLFETPAAKEFLNTGKNPYIGNADAIKAGKKTFQLYSCTACHGAKGEGAVGPNLIDDKWNYAKNVSDKGIFETIWAGTAGGMGAKGLGLMQPDDPSQGLTTDELLKVVAFIRSNAVGAKPVEEAKPATPLTEAAKVTEAVAPVAAATATATAKVANSAKKVTSKKVTKKPVKKPAPKAVSK